VPSRSASYICKKIVFNNLLENVFFTHFGILCFKFFMSLSRHVHEVSSISCNDYCKSYIYNKYGLYNVKGENNALILYFKYS